MWYILLFLISFTANATLADPQQVYKDLLSVENISNPPKLYVVTSNEVNSYYNCLTNNIVLYTGLLVRLRNTDELAFTLAHELSHRLLGHTHSNYDNEYAADSAATIVMLRAGYDVCTGVKMLLLLPYSESSTHPLKQDRYNRVKCS